MGGVFAKPKSTVQQETTTSIKNAISNTCVDSASCKNIREGGLIFTKGVGNVVKANQKCDVSTKCVIEAALTAMQTQKTELENMAKAGLIGAEANTMLKQHTEATTSLTNKCGTVESTNIMKNVPVITFGKFNTVEIDQIGNAKADCYIKSALDAASSIDNATKGTMEGSTPNPLGFLSNFATLGGVIAVSTVVVFLAILYFIFASGSSKEVVQYALQQAPGQAQRMTAAARLFGGNLFD
jgi:hypothetical protein